jgi:hypothetical protein
MYIGSMVVSPDREPDVFGAISHPARRRMLYSARSQTTQLANGGREATGNGFRDKSTSGLTPTVRRKDAMFDRGEYMNGSGMNT